MTIPEGLPPPDTAKQHNLTLHEAIDIALTQNPDVVTARAAAPVAFAARGVAATYPWNPSVQVAAFPYARDINGNLLAVKNDVAVMQTIELAHQQRYRQESAGASAGQEQAKIAEAEWIAVVSAMRAYFTALYKKDLLGLARDSASLADDTAGVVDRRFEAGIATSAERITADVAARQAKRKAELAEADYQTALQALRTALNATDDEPVVPGGNLQGYRWLPIMEVMSPQPYGLQTTRSTSDSQDAMQSDVANRPDVMAAQLGVSVAEANRDLAQANKIPNLTAGPSYERDETGTVFFGIQAQMDLPIWNTGSPLVRQRDAELQQQRITWRQTQLRAASEAVAAAKRYEVARGLWMEMSTSGAAEKNDFKRITDAFENGQASIVEVLSTRDNLILERQARLDLLNQVSQAAVDVVSALAIDPDRVIKGPSSDLPSSPPQP
ncbi:MAG TPA: TolC family protein [Lacipirellulaceae bacterium]|nr:TolC family protein [Lacipirellulaceae bacterium]